jgi:hypothetical protein
LYILSADFIKTGAGQRNRVRNRDLDFGGAGRLYLLEGYEFINVTPEGGRGERNSRQRKADRQILVWGTCCAWISASAPDRFYTFSQRYGKSASRRGSIEAWAKALLDVMPPAK